ncbi:MAG: phospholipase D family protein [Xanthobacteraceae bacterium]
MLLTHDNLLDRFRTQLAKSSRIDVAVAWACSCDALNDLCEFSARHGRSVRVIAGIWGNISDPPALRLIQSEADLRIVPRSERRFHPKLYLFHKNRRCTAWVGSANLTSGGFGQNEELVFEFSDDGSLCKWFNRRWNELGTADDCARTLDDYERDWKPPVTFGAFKSANRDEDAPARADIDKLTKTLSDWSSFVAAISKANSYWSKRLRIEAPVTNENDSWLSTILLGRTVARKPDWSTLSTEERHILLGRRPYGLLGSMGGAGRANAVFKRNDRHSRDVRRRIRRSLQPVIDARGGEFPEAARRFLTEVERIDGFGGAIATRLLALARPDRAISVNAGSRERLAALSGLPASAISRSPRTRGHSYVDLLRWLERQPWHVEAVSRTTSDPQLAETCAALLDALVYVEKRA